MGAKASAYSSSGRPPRRGRPFFLDLLADDNSAANVRNGALQKTAHNLNRDDLGILETQKRLASSTASEVLKLADTFETHRSTIAALMTASKWTEQFRTLRESFAPSLLGIKLAAEQARTLDLTTLRATAESVARSNVVVAAEQVLEAHRLIEAMGRSESSEQSASLLAELISLMGALFSTFGENTMKELRGIGALKLIELFFIGVAIFRFAAPAEMPAAEKTIVAEMQVEVESLQNMLEKILAADEAANQAYVSELPRAELKRDAAIRREARGKSPVLMRGKQGMLLAVKDGRGRWLLVVYRDPLTDQLSEGWVYAPAVRPLDHPSTWSGGTGGA